MRPAFGREALLEAFDQIGRAAVLAETKLQIVVYGGSALMLACNFRFATEDVDVSELERPLPGWLAEVVQNITAKMAGGTIGAMTLSRVASVRSPIARRTIWGPFRGIAPGRGLWFQCPRRNICLPQS